MDTPTNESAKVEEVSLEDIDKILEVEDPGFAKELESVAAVQVDKNLVIETGVIADDDNLTAEVQAEEKPQKLWRKILSKVRERLRLLRIRIKARLVLAMHQLLVFLKTKPKEFFFYSLSVSKIGFKKSQIPVKLFMDASRLQKAATVLLMAMIAGSVWIFKSNLHGIWLPSINEPILSNLADRADWVESYDRAEKGESFYAAFPQERHEFLFPKFKVNLKRTSDNPLPMGAFEVIVLLDSRDTAIEVRDREVEFFDGLQRVFEEETFSDLETEIGKNRLKGHLKSWLNERLTQGWASDINFKTFILKP